jgi:hypothetical protein
LLFWKCGLVLAGKLWLVKLILQHIWLLLAAVVAVGLTAVAGAQAGYLRHQLLYQRVRLTQLQ